MKFVARSVAIAAIALATAFTGNAVPIMGLTEGNRLIRFDSATPGSVYSDVAVSGLTSGHNLIGIDFRALDGVLVGVSRSTTSDDAQVYTINPTTGAATTIGALFAMMGTSGFGFDANPFGGHLTLISDAEVNLRTWPNNNVIVADMLSRNPPNADPTLQISGAAYSNNVACCAPAHTIYVVDSASGNLYTQGSVNYGLGGFNPDTGYLFLVGSLGLGTNIGTQVGLDISNHGLALLSIVGTGGDQLYSFNPAAGAATLVGDIGSANPMIDFAITAIPEPAAFVITLCGLGLVRAGRRLRRRF